MPKEGSSSSRRRRGITVRSTQQKDLQLQIISAWIFFLVFRLLKRSGRSRQGALVLAIHIPALMNSRSSLHALTERVRVEVLGAFRAARTVANGGERRWTAVNATEIGFCLLYELSWHYFVPICFARFIISIRKNTAFAFCILSILWVLFALPRSFLLLLDLLLPFWKNYGQKNSFRLLFRDVKCWKENDVTGFTDKLFVKYFTIFGSLGSCART